MITRMFTRLEPVAQFLPTTVCLKEKIIERLHMNHLGDLIHRLRAGKGDRRREEDQIGEEEGRSVARQRRG